MNDEIAELLKRQAQWQRSRAALSWSEKLRQSVALRRGLSGLRRPSPHDGTGERGEKPEAQKA